MADTAFTYMGKQITVRDEHPDAVVTVEGRAFRCRHHHPTVAGQGLAMWMCAESYFASPVLKELAKHFADYAYLFDMPGRVVVDDDGEVVDGSGKDGGQHGGQHGGHDHGSGEHGGHDHGSQHGGQGSGGEDGGGDGGGTGAPDSGEQDGGR